MSCLPLRLRCTHVVKMSATCGDVSNGNDHEAAKWEVASNSSEGWQYAHPTGTMSLYQPTATLTPVGGEREVITPVVDFAFKPRPGSNHPEAPADAYSSGHMNPM